ncbi:MAG: hypothetical protein QM783_03750 [Phycisphaerales bacterium]
MAQQSLPPGPLRSREIAVDASALALVAAAQGRATVQLFDDLSLPLVVESMWHTPGGIACSGRLEGDSRSAVLARCQ